MDDKKIRDRILKLKALTNSSNINESTRALEMLEKVMDKYSMSEGDINEYIEDEIDSQCWFRDYAKGVKDWEYNLASSVAMLFDCKTMIGYFVKNKDSIVFVGTEEDRDLSISMFNWLRNILLKESSNSLDRIKNILSSIRDETSKLSLDEGLKYLNDIDEDLRDKFFNFHSYSYKLQWLNSASEKICKRIDLILEKRYNNISSNSNELIIVNKKLQKVNDFIDKESDKETETTVNVFDSIAYQEANIFAEKINIDNQVTTEKTKNLKIENN